MIRISMLGAVLAAAIASTGCNLVWGIRPGESCGEKDGCQSGECTAELIAGGGNYEAISIFATADRLLWSVAGDRSIHRTNHDGSEEVSLALPEALPMTYATRIAADPEPSPEFVYFTDHSGPNIGRAPIEGGDIEIFATVPDTGNMARYGNILVHGEHVYWAMQRESYSEPMDPGKDIWRAPRRPAGGAAATAELVIAADRPLGLAADDEYLYFGNSASDSIERIAWSALAEGAPLPATSETVIAAAAKAPGDDIGEMAVDDQFIYWGTGDTVRVQEKSKVGSSSHTTVHAASSYVGGIVADGNGLYFTTFGDGDERAAEVWRGPRGGSGGFPEKVFQAPPLEGIKTPQISSITQDCGHVYFLIRDTAQVFKLAK